MSIGRIAGGWARGAARDWPVIERKLPAAVARAQAGHARGAIETWPGTVMIPLVVAPGRAAVALRALREVVDQAVQQEDVEIVQRYDRTTLAQVDPMDLANALECVGIPLKPESWDTMRAWLPRMEVRRDDEIATFWWTAGFAALALGEPLRYWKAAGLHLTAENHFTPGETFGFNLQGMLRHLGAAISVGASFEDVRPAWEEFVHNFDNHRATSSADEGTLLWVARIVFHRIGGRPLGEVAQALHDSAWTLAGFEPSDLETPVTKLLAAIEAEKAELATRKP